MSLRLSKPQLGALKVLSAHGKGSSYELRWSLVVLNALVRKGLATSHAGLGAMFSPRTAIIYRITDAGRAALASATGGTK